MAVPGLNLGFIDEDPFMPADVVAFGAANSLVAVIGARMRSLNFGVVAAAAVALATPVLESMVTPWNSTVTVFAVLVTGAYVANGKAGRQQVCVTAREPRPSSEGRGSRRSRAVVPAL